MIPIFVLYGDSLLLQSFSWLDSPSVSGIFWFGLGFFSLPGSPGLNLSKWMNYCSAVINANHWPCWSTSWLDQPKGTTNVIQLFSGAKMSFFSVAQSTSSQVNALKCAARKALAASLASDRKQPNHAKSNLGESPYHLWMFLGNGWKWADPEEEATPSELKCDLAMKTYDPPTHKKPAVVEPEQRCQLHHKFLNLRLAWSWKESAPGT